MHLTHPLPYPSCVTCLLRACSRLRYGIWLPASKVWMPWLQEHWYALIFCTRMHSNASKTRPRVDIQNVFCMLCPSAPLSFSFFLTVFVSLVSPCLLNPPLVLILLS